MNAKLFFFGLLFVALACAASNTITTVLVIDPYAPDSDILVVVIPYNPSFPIIQTTYTQDSAILGGERDLELEVLSGLSGRVISTGVSAGFWDVSSPSDAVATVTMQYDGKDKSSLLNTRGLGGIDFTQSGANAFRLDIVTDLETVYSIYVYGQAGGQSNYNLAVAAGTTTNSYYAPYSLFSGNADFSSVGAIEIVIAGGTDVDTTIDLIAIVNTGAAASPTASVSPAPSPAVVGFTWYTPVVGREPCEDAALPKSYFVSEQNIIYYYFYRAYYNPIVYINSAANIAPYLFGTVFAVLLAAFL